MINKRWIHVLNSDYLGKVKLEDDPDGWDNQRINIARSKIFFGLFRTQTSVFRFKGDGYQYVRNVYEIKGTEHVITDGIYEYNSTTKRYELYYTGIIDLSTYSDEEDIFVDVDVNDSSFARKVRSREDVKVNLSRIKSIDGVELPENNQVTVNLHQRELLSTGEFLLNEDTATVESESGLDEGNNWEGFTLPISLQSSNSEIDNLSSQTVIGLYAVGGAFWDPAGEESIVLFTGTVKGTLSKVREGSTQPINVSFLLRVYDDNTLTTVDFDSPISNATFEIPNGQTDVPFTFTINKQFGGVPPAVNIGANAVISLIAQNTNVLGSGNDAFICEFTQIDFTVAQNLQFKDGGPAQGYLMWEAFKRVIQVITDKEDSFKSDYLGRIDIGHEVNGPGAFETLHSSLQIRQIPNTNPSITLKDLFTSLNAQNNLGLGIEFNEVGQPFLRLEEKGHFFSGEVILTVHSVSEFGKDFSRDWAYSSIKVGYDKSATEELNGLEEYNNKFSWDTIIGTFKNELNLVSKIRWDGYGIEKMRRLSFDTNPNEDTKEDNDIFGVVVLEDGVDTNGKKKYKSAKDEAYDIVENIFSPETAYNLDKTPGRMLRANGGVIRAGGLEKYLDDEITFGFAEQKENLKSQKTGESTIIENENIDVKTLDTGFWIPEIYKFKSALTRERFKIIQRKSNGIIKFSTATREETTKYSYMWILEVDSESDDELAQWTGLRVNTSSPQVTLIDPEGDDPDVIIPPIDPSPLLGAFEGAFPFVFVDGVTGNEAYNFSGIEKINIPDVPDFERTSTFIFKVEIVNNELGRSQILWDNLAVNNRGVSITIGFSDKLEIRLQNNSVGFNTILVITDDIIPLAVKKDIEISYDGSSTAAGISVIIDSVSVSLTTSFDQLTGTLLTGSNGFSFGVQKGTATERGNYFLDNLSWKVGNVVLFKTECENDGLVCTDLSGQGNDGVIDLNGTNPNDFFITL